jgi:hypothetical protein
VSISGVDLDAVRNIFQTEVQVKGISEALLKEHAALSRASQNGKSYAYHRMMMDVNNYLPDNILALTDKATMAASVEGRVPLLDHRLVEFAFSLPEKLTCETIPLKGCLKKLPHHGCRRNCSTGKKKDSIPPIKNGLAVISEAS